MGLKGNIGNRDLFSRGINTECYTIDNSVTATLTLLDFLRQAVQVARRADPRGDPIAGKR
jgi:hypothetical protein